MPGTVFEVIQPGAVSTVQDLGRPGYFAAGIPPSGAMDKYSFRFGNLLLKNHPDDAAVEITAVGPKLRVLMDTVIAVTGAPFKATLNREEIPLWQAVPVKAGDVLNLGRPAWGWRGYLSVAGGIDVPDMLGSKSTFVMGKLGGYRGRALKKGDTLNAGTARFSAEALAGRKVKKDCLPPAGGEEMELRVVLGPQDDYVTPDSLAAFVSEPFQVSVHSDRVGYRFHGPRLFFKPRDRSKDAGSDPSNIVDDGNAIGAIQIPAGKEAICMGPDGVSMGGYVKIACLISADMGRMAQVRLNQAVRFKAVEVDEARAALLDSLAQVTEDNIQTA